MFRLRITNVSTRWKHAEGERAETSMGLLSRWKRRVVVNSMQARLRAQLGDSSISSGERRRRSVVVTSIVLTITDPLRGSYPLLCNLQAALNRSCGASFACMELTIISRFQRLQVCKEILANSHFLVLSPISCFNCESPMYQRVGNMPKACPYVMVLSLWCYRCGGGDKINCAAMRVIAAQKKYILLTKLSFGQRD